MPPDLLRTVLWTAAGYLSGSMLFSAVLVRLFKKRNIAEFGDRNPGATNAFKAGGWKLGIPALLLDFLKGALPVGLARVCSGLAGWWLVPVALAPVLGHAFSIFYRFQGGKGAAVTFGIWTGLTLWQGPTFLGGLVGLSLLMIRINLWTVIVPFAAFFAFVLLWAVRTAEYYLVLVWLGNGIIVIIKYLPDLKQPVRFHSWVGKLFGRIDA